MLWSPHFLHFKIRLLHVYGFVLIFYVKKYKQTQTEAPYTNTVTRSYYTRSGHLCQHVIKGV
jgi:hypothetical protein